MTKVVLKKGSLTYNLESNLDNQADVTIEIPNLKKNGEMLKMDMKINSASTMNNTIDLTGYEFNFEEDVDLRYMAYEVNDNERKKLDNVYFSFSDMEYSYVEGNFGQYTFNLPLESLVMDLFSGEVSGSVYFEDPKINLTFNNSFGLPITLKSDILRAQTHNEGQMNITSPISNGIDFNYPSLTEVGSFKTTTLSLNKNTAIYRR